MAGKTRFELIEPLSKCALIARCGMEGIPMSSRRRLLAEITARMRASFDSDALLIRGRRIEPKLSRSTVHIWLRLLQRGGLIRRTAEKVWNARVGLVDAHP